MKETGLFPIYTLDSADNHENGVKRLPQYLAIVCMTTEF